MFPSWRKGAKSENAFQIQVFDAKFWSYEDASTDVSFFNISKAFFSLTKANFRSSRIMKYLVLLLFCVTESLAFTLPAGLRPAKALGQQSDAIIPVKVGLVSYFWV